MTEPRTGSFRRPPLLPERLLWAGRLWYWLKARYRHRRVHPFLTRLLGFQYRRSRSLLELDITYLCNLRCLNCNRSCTQAPEALHMDVGQLRQWVDEWLVQKQRWQRIRVLGGEPTLHPRFDAVIAELERYRAWNGNCLIEVVSNGYGEHVRSVLAHLPSHIWIENSNKTSRIQPGFGPFNLAPCDDHAYRHADYRNGCAIMDECGMGLTPLGYYPCAVAGGIDRIKRAGLGHASLPRPEDDMTTSVAAACALCGRFRDGHYVPRNLRPHLLDAQISPTWRTLYEQWRSR